MTTPWTALCLTIFPELFPGPLAASLTGAALEKGLWQIEALNLRDFTTDKHRSVDDTPAGGGPGMVMRADIIAKAMDKAIEQLPDARRIYLSPRGVPFTQSMAHELANERGVILLCGRFEGVDERVLEAREIEEVSIGDFVMTGGEMAAYCLLDAVVRLRPGVVGSQESLASESFEDGMLEHPHYTRPRLFEGREIPSVLLEGNHKKIEEYRRAEAIRLTRLRRPDLFDDE